MEKIVKYTIYYEPIGFYEEDEDTIKDLKKFKNKVKRIFETSKVPGKSLVKTIQVCQIDEYEGTAHTFGRHDGFVIGKYDRFGNPHSDKRLKDLIQHEVGHIYERHHPEVQKDFPGEKFALIWGRRKWR